MPADERLYTFAASPRCMEAHAAHTQPRTNSYYHSFLLQWIQSWITLNYSGSFQWSRRRARGGGRGRSRHGRPAADDFDGAPAVNVYCVLRSSRLIRYRCACRSTRRRMSTTFCSRSRSRRPACRSSGRARFAWLRVDSISGPPLDPSASMSSFPGRQLYAVAICVPDRNTQRPARRPAADRGRRLLHPVCTAKRHRRGQRRSPGEAAPWVPGEQRAVSSAHPLPHPLPHHHPPSLLLLFSRAHARARGVQADLGTAAALRATKRSSGLQVRRPSHPRPAIATRRGAARPDRTPSLPLPPSRRRPLRSAQRPVPSRRPLARRPTSRQSTAELGRRRASAVAWRIRSRRMGGPTGWAPCLRASRTGSTATCPPASATPRRRMACRTLSRPGRHRPPSVSTLPLPAPTPLSPLVGTRRCTTCRCTCRSQPRRRNGGGRCAMVRRQWAWDTCRRPRRLTSEPRTRRRRRCTELPLASETRTRPSALAHPRSPLLVSLQSRRPSNATA